MIPVAPRTTGRRAPLAALALLALATACAERRKGEDLPVEATASRIDVFVQASGPLSDTIVMEVAEVRARDEAGVEHPLPLRRDTISSGEADRRVLLAGGIVPPGGYETLVLRLRSARLQLDGTPIPLQLLPAGATAADLRPEAEAVFEGLEYELQVLASVRFREAASLFLEWRVDESVVQGSGFHPVFGTAVETPRATLGLMYATDSATGSIVAIQRSSGNTVATAKVGDEPLGLALSRDRRALYVGNARDGSLSIVDLQQGFSISTIPVRLSAGTCDVVLADPPVLVAAVNRQLSSVSLFDVVRSVRVADVPVGRDPVRLVASERERRLYVVNSQSDNLSVIDVNSRNVVATVPLEASPTDVTIDRRERELFVGHRTSRNLLAIDLRSLQVTDTISVGGNVTAVLADRRRDRVYVARSTPPELLIVDRRVAAVIRRIPLSGPVVSMAQPSDGPNVYGASPGLRAIVVVNVISGREEPSIPCGTRPSDVVVVD